MTVPLGQGTDGSFKHWTQAAAWLGPPLVRNNTVGSNDESV